MTVLSKMVGFVTTTDPARARAFYEGVLGFEVVGEDAFALVLDAHGTTIRVVKAREFTPGRGTVLGWEVEDMEGAIDALVGRGVRFERYDLPFMKQDDQGVWTTPEGDQVAWFEDPDGNTLSISRHETARGR